MKYKLLFSIPKTGFLGSFLYVTAIHEILFIIEIHLSYSGNVGRNTHVVIRNPLCYPDSAGVARARTINFEVPYLIFISHSKAFSPIRISILFSQTTHQCDGFTGCFTILKRHPLELFDIKEPGFVAQFRTSFGSGFTDGKLFFIKAGIGHIQKSKGLCPNHGNTSLFHHIAHIPGLLVVHHAFIDRFHITN